MKEVRIHARAGQGAITTATILGQAVFLGERFAYCFPHFGAARMGAPMNAFVRIDDREIRLRSQIKHPDYLIVADPTLLAGFDCLAGFKQDGIALINASQELELSEKSPSQKIYFVPASEIAQEVLGRPLGNTALLGAFAAATGEIKLDLLIEAINRRFSSKVAQGNIEAAKRGFEYINNKKPETRVQKPDQDGSAERQ
jgi:pyruvate ferredoxin oxidoreductase gamma subunit